MYTWGMGRQHTEDIVKIAMTVTGSFLTTAAAITYKSDWIHIFHDSADVYQQRIDAWKGERSKGDTFL